MFKKGQSGNRNMVWQKGKSGNPRGRPKGAFSIKDDIRKHLQAHPEELKDIINYFVKESRELMWQMLEGKPDSKLEVGVPQNLIDLIRNATSVSETDTK